MDDIHTPNRTSERYNEPFASLMRSTGPTTSASREAWGFGWDI